MPFVESKSVPGLIYEPEENKIKKHNCKDCFSCQMCSDARCELCLRKKSKISVEEKI
ncbi:MAG TPA: hypothetical protein PLO89_10110 [Spirochaetota bacterium]|nr:hypothetical protein [Spirochaetota bacterium]